MPDFNHVIKPKLTFILPTEAKLEDSARSGLLPRWAFYFRHMESAFDVEVYSCDAKSFSDALSCKHHCLPVDLSWLPYGNQLLYNLYLVLRAPFMSRVVRVISATYILLPLLRIVFRKKIMLSYHYDYITTTRKEYGGLKGRTARLRVKLSLASADLVTCTTSELAVLVAEMGRPDASILPNFVDTMRFRPSPKENLILYAGRIVWQKGIDYLLEAFRRLELSYQEVRLILAGEGDLGSYGEKATQLGIQNVQFLGPIPNDEIADLMGRAKVFVLATVHREGHPKAIIEAMACGCCCLASRVEGNKDLIVDGENGMLFEPRDSGSLFEALEDVWSGRANAGDISQKAVSFAQQFSADALLEKEIRLIEGLSRP